MKMTNAEKLITVMLCEVMEQLDINRDIDPEFVKEAVFNDHLWALEWQYQGIFGDSMSPTPPKVSFVTDVLDMWYFVEHGCANLSDRDKERVEAEVPFGIAKFEGFDGNNETEYMSIARFLVEKLNRFTNFKGRAFNSHMPCVDRYQKMLQVFAPIRDRLDGTRPLSADEIIQILKREVA
ncbi:YfbU family protein [Burkholderia vietnamiensis]|uniref:YfbU family protein n=1 Tax=Burkholderia vietnamiensis TaxID=60552 RepID=UPI0007568182|nr:YfbU family protein [Burkholderia vietnamiensis]KVE87493.1 hypothetical protein WJ00_10685 [Burkholderia vietnamiensis]